MFSHMLEKMYVIAIVFTMYYNFQLAKDLPNLIRLFSEDHANNLVQECRSCGFETGVKTRSDNSIEFVPISTIRRSANGRMKAVKRSKTKGMPNNNRQVIQYSSFKVYLVIPIPI